MGAMPLSIEEMYKKNDAVKPLSIEEMYAKKPQENHEIIPYLGEGIKGLAELGGSAASGAWEAVKHPIKTAQNIGLAIHGTTGQDIGSGIDRAIRHTPIVGSLYENDGLLGPTIKGGAEGYKKAHAEHMQHRQETSKSDALHMVEHPLTDFIQKTVGMLALPGGAIAQVGTLALDAFHKSLERGNDVIDALHDAKNAAAFVGMTIGAGKAIPAMGKGVKNVALKEANIPQEYVQRYKENPEAVRAAAKIPKGQIPHDMMKHLEEQNATLKNKSLESIDVLINEGHTFKIRALQQAITNQMQSLKTAGVRPTFGEDASAYNALIKFRNEVKTIREYLKRSGVDVIPAPIVKRLIQKLDDSSEAAYAPNRGAGGLSPVAASKMSSVRYAYNKMLRDASPEYARIMNDLAPHVESVREMSKFFGKYGRAMKSLKAAENSNTPRGYEINEVMKKHDQITGNDFHQKQKDVAIAHQFEKGTTNGSRKGLISGNNLAAVGSTIGGASGAFLGGPGGAAVGAGMGYVGGKALGSTLGGLADIYGGKAVQGALDAGIALDRLTPKYAKTIMDAYLESPKSAAVANFIMSKSDPEYQKLISGH